MDFEWMRDRKLLAVSALAALFGVIAIVALVAAVGDSGPQMCTFDNGQMKFTYDCSLARDDDRGTAAATTAAQGDPWWASDTAQTTYAFLGFGASAAGGAWAFWRVRQRRERLQEAMRRIEETQVAHQGRPAEGARALVALRHEMRAAFRQGRFDDQHFLELDKRAAAAVTKLRLLELDTRFPILPPGLRNQVTTLIGDGSISQAEIELVRASLATQLVPGRVRDELLILLGAWAAQDAGATHTVDVLAPDASPETVVLRVQEP